MAKTKKVVTSVVDKDILIEGLGDKFRHLREKKNLSTKEAASQLFLSEQTIIELEANDYSHASSPTYTRGYLKNYAKLLGMSDEEINEEIAKLGLKTPTLAKEYQTIEISAKARRKAYRSRMPRRYLRWINIGILILIIMAVIIWWHGRSNAPINQPTAITDDEETVQQVIIPATTNQAPQEKEVKPKPTAKPNAQQDTNQQKTAADESQTISSTPGNPEVKPTENPENNKNE